MVTMVVLFITLVMALVMIVLVVLVMMVIVIITAPLFHLLDHCCPTTDQSRKVGSGMMQ